MARGNTSTAHVVISMEGQQAVNLMKALQNQVKRTRQELEAMERAGQMDTDDYKNKQKELQSMERAIRANRTAYIDLDKIVKNLSGTTLGQLQKALKECRKQMQNLSADDPKMKKLVAQYRAIDNQIGQITGQWRRQDGAIKSVIKRLTAYVSVYGAFNFIKNQLTSVAKDNLEFSDSLADIRKTTGLSTDAVKELSAAISKIDSRQSVQELHKLAYEAGKLGIGSQGVEGVLGFVKAADKLGVALKEDLGDDAILHLTKMADVMGLTKKLGVEKALTSIGSAINELSMASTASGSFMVDYSKRLSGIATQAHLTTAELLGFAAASDATGQEVEVSATAMNKFVVQLQTHYKTVAKAAGINAEALHNMLTMGKTADAVVMVLEALGNKGGLSMVAPLMKDMGSDGARLTASLSTMASNIDLVKKQLELSREAFEENISVTNEYNIKNETAAAIMERMRNSWTKLFTNADNSEVMKGFAQDLYNLSTYIQSSGPIIGSLTAALHTLMFVLKSLVAMTPYLLTFFSLKGIVIGLAHLPKLLVGLKAIGRSFIVVGTSATGATTATLTFGSALRGVSMIMKSNVFLLVASAVAALVVHLTEASQEMTELEKDIQSLNNGFKNYQRDASAAAIQSDFFFNKLKNAKKGTKEYKDLLDEINTQYKDYLPALLTEKSSLEDIATAQQAVNDKLRQSLALKAKNAALDETSQNVMKDMADARARIEEIFTSAGLKGIGETAAREVSEIAQHGYAKGIKSSELIKQFAPMFLQGDKSEYANALYRRGQSGAPAQNIFDSAVKYVETYYRWQDQVKRINEKYNPLIGDFTLPEEINGPYTIIESQSDSEKNKERNAALKKAKDEHDAVMSAIEVYYKMEQQVVNEQYLKGEIAAAEHEQKLAEIEDRGMNTRIAARKALLGRDGASEEWLAELNKMDQEALSITNETQQAMLNLRGKNLSAIGAALRKFGDGEMDGIWKKMEEDRVKGQEQQIKMQKEVEAILLKYDYTGKVTDQFLASMQKLGYFKSEITNEAGEIVSLSRAQLESEFEKLYTIYNDLFSIDIATPEGIEEFKAVIDGLGLSSVNLEAFKKSLQGLGLTSEQEAQRVSEYLTLLYDKTVEYGDAMVEAEEKARKRQLKISDALYKRTPQYKQDKAREDTEKETKDVYKYAQQLGLASDIMVQDQEVKLFEARLEAAKNYYEYLKSTGADTTKAELELQEATAELASAITGQIKEKLDVLRSYGDNLEQFGADFGEAMFGHLDDRQDALESFVRAVGKSTQELIMNWVKQKIEHAILRKAMVKMEGQAQKQMTGAVEEGQEQENTIMQTGGEMQKAITTQVGAQLTQQKNKQASESVAASAKETQAEGTLGIAQGAAKTIGKLGWWGIPLVAVITALINGLLSAAMSKVGSLFGGSSADAGAVATPKLVTGMLTYDSGNVQSVLGDNGSVYSARMGGVSGTGLVSVPTLTNVGGQAALVGEEGPEIVIGRATTRALQQDNSGLLQGLIHFDRLHSGRGFRRFDDGNIGAFVGGNPNEDTTARILDAVMTVLAPTLAGVQESLQASARANNALRDRLNKPIQSVINKNGRGGLIDEVATGLEQERRSGRNDTVRRLFGR